MANRILVVDDNSDIRENICEYLNLRGHQTIGASDAASAAQLIAEEDIALIVLDVGLPGEDGMSFCRRLRLAGSSILILMLTARDAVDDRVAGLESGADDYVIKPFSLLELNARVEALLRRAGLSGMTAGASKKLQVGSLPETAGSKQYEIHRSRIQGEQPRPLQHGSGLKRHALRFRAALYGPGYARGLHGRHSGACCAGPPKSRPSA